MSHYLIKLAIIHIALILGYWLLLRKEQKYGGMRFYLLSATLLALIIPTLNLPGLLFMKGSQTLAAVYIKAFPTEAVAIAPAADPTQWKNDLLLWIYIAVSLGFLFKFFSHVFYLISLKQHSIREHFNGRQFLRTQNIQGSFTFFKWIFLSEDIDKNQPDFEVILQHENAHVNLGHTYDIIFIELFKAFFWWLPTAWLINKEIRKIHEYQADAYVLQTYHIDQYSSILISSTLKTNGLGLASSFHDGLIFKRLTAMKQQAKKVSPWKLGTLGSLGIILFVVFACSEEPQTTDLSNQANTVASDGDLFTIVEELPEYQGGMDAFYQYVGSELKYPQEARQQGVEGRVDVEFVVERDGAISNVKAINGIGAGCDSEAIKVVQNAHAFKPGKQRGRTVRVRMIMPIIFQLNNDSPENNGAQATIVLDDIKLDNNKFKVDAHYADGAWSGTVYDETGEQLPGVNIVAAGTNTGTVSDLDGTFTLKTDKPKDVYLSFVGYETAKLADR